MPGDRPQRSPTAPALTRLPAAGHFFLRPQRLAHISVLPPCCVDSTVVCKNDRPVKPAAQSNSHEQ
jgi:hypothetical protein